MSRGNPTRHHGSVIVVGDIVTDVLALHRGTLAAGSDTAAEIRIIGGGSAANTAAWLAAEGASVTLCGVVGDDDAGAMRVAELVTLGVRCAVRQTPGTATGSVVVLSDGDERTMLCDRGANALLCAADIDAALASDPKLSHLHVSGYVFFDPRSAPAGRHALAAARSRGLTTSVDAASAAPLQRLGAAVFAEWVSGVDLLLANLDEARALTQPTPTQPTPTQPGAAPEAQEPAALARTLLTMAHRVVVKAGAQGAAWADEAGMPRSYWVPAYPVTTVVDPTGAGDAFAAGLLSAWRTGADPMAALTAGARLGSRAVATLGGRPPPRV